MTTFKRVAISGVTMLSMVATVAAAGPKSDVAALEDSRDTVAWQANNAKGVDRTQLNAEAERIQSLIDTLERGGNVDAAEIDHTLNRAGSERSAGPTRGK
jgi:uncharacterized protein YlxW (UPF0749 family)